MDSRKEQILNIIVKEYIKTGVPIGSEVIAGKHKLDVSPATVRNDMAILEDEGYIIQPHISAGRVPSEKAYNYYLRQIKKKKKEKIFKDKEFDRLLNDKSEIGLKKIAKYLANKSNLAVFWAFHRHNVYYTGLSNLFSQPEFAQVNVLYDISAVIDRIDEIVNQIFDEYGFETEVALGEKNPFGNLFGTVLAKYKLEENIGLFGVVGPMRMDYEENLNLIKLINNQICEK
ncbi:MAG: HTH domain-containing protein [Patescibacteria group bacterium]|nr:HTH domain-containing protein [Patescibacteria group bacterium]